MPAQLSPNLRATLEAYVLHGIDGIEAQSIVRAAKAEPDVAAALDTIREEYGPQFTVGGRLSFEQAAASALHCACDVPPRRPIPGGRMRAQVEQLLRELEGALTQLQLQHERKQNIGILAALSALPQVVAATLVMTSQDRIRMRSLEADLARAKAAQASAEDPEEQVQKLTLSTLRVEQLIEAASDATHALVEMLAARDGEPRAQHWLREAAKTTPPASLERLRQELPRSATALLKKAYPHDSAESKQLRESLQSVLTKF